MKYRVDNINNVINDVINKSEKALLQCWIYLEWKLKNEIQNDSYDTGQLVRSISTQKISKDKIIVWSNLEYALVREYGRKPWRFPPLQALVWWTARKGMISWWATQRYEDLHYTDKGIIYVIARAIATRWIEWKHTFERTIKGERENIINLFAKIMNEW